MAKVMYVTVRIEIETAEPISNEELFENLSYEFGYLDPNYPAAIVETELTEFTVNE